MSLDNIANVVISLTPAPLSLAGFGTPMVAAVLTAPQETAWDTNIGASVNTTSTTAGSWKSLMTTLGVTSTELLYGSLNAIFSQDVSPSTVKIGRRATPVAQIQHVNIDAAEAGTYTVTVNGTDYTFVATAETATQIKDALIPIVDADPAVTTASVDTDTFSITADEAGVTFSVAVDHSVTPANISTSVDTASVGIIQDIQTWETEDSDWYELIESTRSSGVITDAASDIESRIKIFQAQTDDAAAQVAGSTDLGSVLGALSYDRTGLWWHDDDTEHVEAAISGKMLPTDPGSATWANQTIKGVPGIVPTGESFLLAKNYNWNENFPAAGFTMTREGKMIGGQFIDVIRGRDWLQNLVQTRLVEALRNEPKIPYTDNGGQIIGGIIRAALVEASDAGVITEDSIVVTIPKVATQSTTDKGNRYFPNVTFSATLQGAIHSLDVNGSLDT